MPAVSVSYYLEGRLKRRSGVGLVRTVKLRHSARYRFLIAMLGFRFLSVARGFIPHARCRKRLLLPQLSANKPDRRAYSIDDLGDGSERRPPPVIDSSLEDEGFGAYDYQFDPSEFDDFPDEFGGDTSADQPTTVRFVPIDEEFTSTKSAPQEEEAILPQEPDIVTKGIASGFDSSMIKIEASAPKASMFSEPDIATKGVVSGFDSLSSTTENQASVPKASLYPEEPDIATKGTASDIDSSTPKPEESETPYVSGLMSPDLVRQTMSSWDGSKATVTSVVPENNPSSPQLSSRTSHVNVKPIEKATPEKPVEMTPPPARPTDTSEAPPRSSPRRPSREEMERISATHFHAAEVRKTGAAKATSQFVVKAASGTGATTELDTLKSKLVDLESEVYALNDGAKFNINSVKQVATAIYGAPGQSTSKDALEGLAGGGNKLAASILEYRQTKAAIKRFERRGKIKKAGNLVGSVSTVTRHSSENNEDIVVVEQSDPVMLVDASAYIFRAYYSMPPIHRSDGTPTGAVMGFCNMLSRLILNRIMEGDRPKLILVFDAKGSNFRHDLYPDYKGHRPECPIDLVPQFDLVREAAKAFGIAQIEAPYYEADDVIATLASMALEEGLDTNILSGDKDLWQLVTSKSHKPSVHMIDPMSMERITYDTVVEKWGCGPDQLGDILALAGDSADNVPGVPGIGPKIAAALISEYGTLENLLENVDDIKQAARKKSLKENMAQARLSRELVDLKRDLPLDAMTFPESVTSVRELRMEAMNSERILEFYELMGFKDLKRRFKNRLAGTSTKKPAKSSSRPKTTVPEPKDYDNVPF